MVSGKPEDFAWRITRHACRACMGRVLEREAFTGKKVYRCSNCGIEREGASETALCCCGIRFGKAQRDAGIRCVPNPLRTPECMSEVVAVQAVLTGTPGARTTGDTRAAWGGRVERQAPLFDDGGDVGRRRGRDGLP